MFKNVIKKMIAVYQFGVTTKNSMKSASSHDIVADKYRV